jgi:tetratricopeptide (TPR) repeat protein
MKRLAYPLLFLTVFLVFGCGGGHTVQPTSEALSDGMKELRKGIGWYQKGCYQKSLENFLKACELFAASDELAGTAMCMNNLGNVYRFIGDPESALLFFDEAYAIYTDLNQDQGAIQALANKSAVLIQENRLEEADAVIQSAEALVAATARVSIPLLNNKGILLTKKKEYDAAEKIFNQALQAIAADNLRAVATVNAAIGNLKMEIGAYDQAIDFFNKALLADRASEFHVGLAEDLAAIGTAYFYQKKYEPALKYLQRGLKIYAIFGNRQKVSHINEMMTTASEATGIDISVTRHFVDKWAAGKLTASPCQ